MAYVVTDLCTKCLACTKICPVTCIHPCEGEAGLDKLSQVFINPDECIDCGACASECPVAAIFPKDDLPDDKRGFAEVNAKHYKK